MVGTVGLRLASMLTHLFTYLLAVRNRTNNNCQNDVCSLNYIVLRVSY